METEIRGDESPPPQLSFYNIINRLHYKIGIQQSKIQEYESIIERNRIEQNKLKKEIVELENKLKKYEN